MQTHWLALEGGLGIIRRPREPPAPLLPGQTGEEVPRPRPALTGQSWRTLGTQVPAAESRYCLPPETGGSRAGSGTRPEPTSCKSQPAPPPHTLLPRDLCTRF